MAAATITIAHQRQISVPADLTVCGFDDTPLAAAIRSEEHTSELQSLMRISYAVFCLKKKKEKDQTNDRSNHHIITKTNKEYSKTVTRRTHDTQHNKRHAYTRDY